VRSVAVVGASLAGLRTAEALRAQGFDGRLVVVGAERHRPYDRPPLSKGFLLGTVGTDALALSEPDGDDALAAEWRLGVAATRLDPAGRRLLLSDGDEVTVDGVVLATGGTPRTLPGTEGVDGVLTLRTLDDALVLRERLLAGPEHVVVVGAGFLGAEVAASCHTLGLAVTVVETMDVPLAGAVGPLLGAVCGQLHTDHGVGLVCGHGVAGLVTGDGPTVRGVVLDDGRTLPADLVVVAIGMRPTTDWLAGSGVAVADGVRTDGGWCTSVPGVVAVGDVARHDCGGRPLRHEHWTNAAEQPSVAVANLLAGRHTGHCAGGGYFWSDQYGVRIQFAGSIIPSDDVRVVEGALADRAFLATYHRDGVTTGVFAMNTPRSFVRARRALAATGPGHPDPLSRPDEEDDTCRNCSSAEHGAARWQGVGTTSSTPSTRA
jgi:3-phenylpropionate/trans-cinnamate dioxygenase ferredoxin reductase subunit